MAGKIIPLRLDQSIEFERDIQEHYRALPKTRRGEFLRNLLKEGWERLQAGGSQGPGAAPAPNLRPAPARTPTPTRAPAAPAAKTTEVAGPSVRESAGALKGLFGDAPQD